MLSPENSVLPELIRNKSDPGVARFWIYGYSSVQVKSPALSPG